MQPLEIDSAVFCDGAHYTIISRENSSILTCPVANGAHGYTLNRAAGRGIDREIGRLTGHAACIAVDIPTWCRIAGDPLDAVADALADLLDETPSRFELEQLAAASPLLASPCSRKASPPPRTPTRSPGAAVPRSCAGCRARSCTPPRSWPPRRRYRRPGDSAGMSRKRSAPPKGCSPPRSASAGPIPPRSESTASTRAATAAS